MKRWKFTVMIGLAGVLAAAGGLPAQESGQQAASPRAEGLVSLATASPEEVRVGESFQYQIVAKNVSDDVVLRNVVIRQQVPEGYQIEQSDPSSEGAKDQQGKPKPIQQGAAQWRFDHLGPGEEKTIRVTAVSDKEGSLDNCLSVSYQPAVCMATRFVKPEVQLTKQAPEQSGLCEPLTFRYLIRNTGSGATDKLTLRDKLPEGFKSADGKDMVQFDIEPIAAGQTREFTSRIQVSQGGDKASRSAG